MDFGLETSTDLQVFPPTDKLLEKSILSKDFTDTTGALNNCVAQVERFLHELIAMTGQAAPILELQLGEILTRTSVETTNQNYLLIVAFLPKCRRSHYVPHDFHAAAKSSVDIEFLWHADEGRYMGVCRIPVADLPDERSVMDAILTASDQAAAWFSSIRAGKKST